MKELNEYKKEIFIRGEEKIRNRRKNISLLISFCIPICLCVVAFSVFILPAIMPADKAAPEMNDEIGCLPDDNGCSEEIVFLHVEIEDSEGDLKKIEKEYIDILYSTVNSLLLDFSGIKEESFEDYEISLENTGGSESETSFDDEMKDGKTTSSNNYRILFVSEEHEYEFTLLDNILTDKTSGKTVCLTEEKLKELQELIDKGE